MDRTGNPHLLGRSGVFAVTVLASVDRPCSPNEVLLCLVVIMARTLRTSGSFQMLAIGDLKGAMNDADHVQTVFVVVERREVVQIFVAVDDLEPSKCFLDRSTLISCTMFAPFTSQVIVGNLGKRTVNSTVYDNWRVGVLVCGLSVIKTVAVDFTCSFDELLRGQPFHEGIYLGRWFDGL